MKKKTKDAEGSQMRKYRQVKKNDLKVLILCTFFRLT